MEKIIEWIKGNKIIAIAAGALLALFAVQKFMRPVRRRRRLIPGTRKYSTKRFPKRARAKRVYTKGGKAKKPWQVKGSLAARRHMARLRKMR